MSDPAEPAPEGERAVEATASATPVEGEKTVDPPPESASPPANLPPDVPPPAETPVSAAAPAPAANTVAPIVAVAVVGFHHDLGNRVEYVHPPFEPGTFTPAFDGLIPVEWQFLPFLALPDGVHGYDADHVFFQLPALGGETGPLHGVACYRQIDSNPHKARDAEVTRNRVQKTVVVISLVPLYGRICAKADMLTQLYIQQTDLEDRTMLLELYNNLNASIRAPLTASDCFVDISARDLVHAFRHKLLEVIKIMLLQRKVLVNCLPASLCSSTVLALASLVPGLLECMSPQEWRGENESYALFGLPLPLFNDRCQLEPYFSLQQLSQLESARPSGFLLGTSNLLFAQGTACAVDVLLDPTTSTCRVTAADAATLSNTVALGPADLTFIDRIVTTVDATWQAPAAGVEGGGAHEPDPAEWQGSDAWIRWEFQRYFQGFAAVLRRASSVELLTGEGEGLAPFGGTFVQAFVQTRAYNQWKRAVAGVEMIEHPGHPCVDADAMDAVGIRIQNRLHDISPGLQPLKHALATGATSMGKVMRYLISPGGSAAAQPQPDVPVESPATAGDGTAAAAAAAAETPAVGLGVATNGSPATAPAEAGTSEPPSAAPETAARPSGAFGFFSSMVGTMGAVVNNMRSTLEREYKSEQTKWDGQ